MSSTSWINCPACDQAMPPQRADDGDGVCADCTTHGYLLDARDRIKLLEGALGIVTFSCVKTDDDGEHVHQQIIYQGATCPLCAALQAQTAVGHIEWALEGRKPEPTWGPHARMVAQLVADIDGSRKDGECASWWAAVRDEEA